MALLEEAGASPIQTTGAPLIKLKPIAVADSKSVPEMTTPFGVAAVPWTVAGGGVFVGDRYGTGRVRQIDAVGRQVRCMRTVVHDAQSLCVAHGKVFVVSSADQSVRAIRIETGESMGEVEMVGADGKAGALDHPTSMLVVDDVVIVVERDAAVALRIYLLPRRFTE
jgi:hypothetical protein